MEARVYGIPGSHPVKAAELMLDRKGIAYRRTDLPVGLIRALLPALGFDGGTVPAIKVAGRRIQTTRAISRALDELVPEHPLFPADPGRRAVVEEAERWGDEVLQAAARRLSYGVLMRDRSTVITFIERPILGLPPKLAAATAAPLLVLGRRLNSAYDAAVKADLAELPGMLDHVDELIADGVIGGAEPNAADFQIFTSIRLLMAFADFDELTAPRRSVPVAQRVVPDFAGFFPRAIPPEWIPAAA